MPKPIKKKMRSSFETSIRQQLEQHHILYHYEPQEIKYVLNCSYKPDFLLENGVFIEAKGLFDEDDRRKHLAIKEQHPTFDIRFVFQKAKNKIRKGSSTTYGDWCTKNGIQWADGKIPEEWMK